MADSRLLAAEILETSATGYAAAAQALMEQSGSPRAREGADSRDTAYWKSALTQRILELAAAVRVDEPAVFSSRVNWLRRANRARGSDDAPLLALILSVRETLTREFPSDLQPAVVPMLDRVLSDFESEVDPDTTALDSTTAHGQLGLKYLAACLDGRPDDALRLIAQALSDGLSPEEAYTQILVPAQRETGLLWHSGDISVGEERLVSETSRQVMAFIVQNHAQPVGDRTLIAASVAGNEHDLGLRVVGDLFRLAGWRSLFLGANMPAQDIARIAGAFDVDLVLLTATLPTQLKALMDSVRAVRHATSRARILVGGMAFEANAELWRQVGADGYAASAEAAVEAGTKLLAGGPPQSG